MNQNGYTGKCPVKLRVVKDRERILWAAIKKVQVMYCIRRKELGWLQISPQKNSKRQWKNICNVFKGKKKCEPMIYIQSNCPSCVKTTDKCLWIGKISETIVFVSLSKETIRGLFWAKKWWKSTLNQMIDNELWIYLTV